ncbi:hypothetical protein D210916BOD24_27380 [Alteromonas sp. D210916BOD_24]|uniref:LicD family protein n=1 Tax=Alteromonas sp. D210916BOD_24 TaxID=3157618 RepID=UPI00399D4758
MEYAVSQAGTFGGALSDLYQPFTDSRLSSSYIFEHSSFFVSTKAADSNDIIFAISGMVKNTTFVDFSLVTEHGEIAHERVQLSTDGDVVNAFIKVPLSTLEALEPEAITLFSESENGKEKLLNVSKFLLINFFKNALRLRELMPSRGYFGGLNHSPLLININEKVKTLFLRIDNTSAYLNYTSLKLYNHGGTALDNRFIEKVHASSNVSATDLRQVLATGGGFHSRREDCPHLTITFTEPVYIGQLEILNRRDKWGSRIHNLAVSVMLRSNEILPVYTMQCSYSVEKDYVVLEQLHSQLLASPAPYPKRKTLLAAIVSDLESKLNQLEDKHFSIPLQVLSSWDESYRISDTTTHQSELSLLALYVFHKTKQSLSLSLNSFSRLLANTSDIEQLERNINQYRDTCSLQPIKLTKHGAARQGMLVSNTESVLLALDEVMSDLSEAGFKPCLAYGTLLGAKRENKFISHDDDVDILVELSISDTNESQVQSLMENVKASLDEKKYRVSKGSKTTKTYNIHCFHKKTNIMIDIFPYWFNKEEAYLHMEKMMIRAMPKAILAERDELQLYEKSYPVPKDTIGFLTERYGENWSKPDRYHEWPWPVNVDTLDSPQ